MTIETLTAPLYGSALVAAGMLAASAIGVSNRGRVLDRLGSRAMAGDGRPRSERDSWLARRAVRCGWPWRAPSYLGAHACAAMAGWTVGGHLTGPVGSFAGAIGASLGIEGWLSGRLARARERVDEQLRDVITALAAGSRAGLSIRRSLAESAIDAEEPLRAALCTALRRTEIGEPLEEALEELATRFRSSDARLLATVLAVHARSGGDLPLLLEDFGTIVGARVQGRRQLRALTAQARASGLVLAILPLAFVALLSGTSGGALAAFYRSQLGSTLLLGGLTLQGVGLLWLRRIARGGRRG